MKRPSMYDHHEKSLKTFVELFNAAEDGLPLVMQIYQTENYRDDGIIVNTRTGKRIAFDWEIRDKYFEHGVFKFDTLGQFERKIKKDEIGLSLQCDKQESAVLVAWHQDWRREKPQTVRLKTDFPAKERGTIRTTRHFKIYRYGAITEFRSMIHRALQSGCFDHGVF
ncbi:MAG: hypothetical protein ACE5D8_08330 [Fidelibacterota bacterium]